MYSIILVLVSIILIGCFSKIKIGNLKYNLFFSKEYVETIKGIAAILIVLNHIALLLDGNVYLKQFASSLGVPIVAIFFFCSGYGTMYNYLNKKDYLNNYIKNKFFKIIIPYVIISFVYFAFELLRGSQIRAIFEKCLLGDPIATYSWYIIAIIYLYLAFYISYKQNKVNSNILFILFNIIYYIMLRYVLVWEIHWYASFWAFLYGMISVNFKEKFNFFKFVLYVFCFIFFYKLTYNKESNYYYLNLVLISLLTPTVIFELSKKVMIKSKIISYISQFSFEIYLLHGIVLRVLRKIKIAEIFSVYTYVVLLYLITFLISYLFNRIYNKKILVILKENRMKHFFESFFIRIISILPRKIAHKLLYYIYMKKKLDLKNPVDFNEKIQYLIVNELSEKEGKLSDKIEMKKYISNQIGEEFVPKTYKVYNNIKEVNIEELPNRFVLKTNHGSGNVFICLDKHEFDFNKCFKKLKINLKKDFSKEKLEYHYKYIQPKILCEEYLDDKENKNPIDYKFYCYDGKVECILVCSEREKNLRLDYYDLNWNYLDYAKESFRSGKKIEKPEKLNEMIEIAKKLSNGFKFVRVDLYSINNRIYVGELTFTPAAGLVNYNTDEALEYLGKLIKL